MRAVAIAAAAVLFGCRTSGEDCDEPVMVFAAASLRDALRDVVEPFPGRVRFNFAGSNTLAMQIEAADAADVFISADMAWMDRLEAGGKLVEGSRRTLLSNTLVVVAHRDAALTAASADMLRNPAVRHVSIGDPDAVPAGRYARAWMQDEGVWDDVSDKVAPAADVRAALRVVEADPAVLGIVYATDAGASDRVRVLFEAQGGPQIRYPAALVKRGGSCPAAVAFLEHLEASDGVFAEHGFEAL